VESSLARRALAVHRYPVAAELAALGFEWFPADDPSPLSSFLDAPDDRLLERNRARAVAYFGLDAVAGRLLDVLAGLVSS
jgi:hypothetical protein